MTKDELTALAEQNGVEIDGRWTKDRIEAALTDAGVDVDGEAPKKSGKTMPVRTLRAVWDESGERHPKGVVIELSLELGKKMLAESKVERADPLPGEE